MPAKTQSTPILIITGPTGSGKTPLSLEIARNLDIEIISADSRQIYEHLNIGTAKPSREELAAVRHHFIDIMLPDQDYNAGNFSKDARETVEDILRRGKVPVVVGGSGLYVQALVDGFFDGPPRDPALRRQLEAEMVEIGNVAMYKLLQEIDPAAAATMDPTKPRRIVRALEVYRLTGTPISVLQEKNTPLPYPTLFIGLEWDRKILYERINRRTEVMLENGLLNEVESLRAMGYARDLNSLQTVGYREAFQYLHSEISYDRMVELIKQNTRRYAKRQLTWFRAEPRMKWVTMDESTDLKEIVPWIMRGISEFGVRNSEFYDRGEYK